MKENQSKAKENLQKIQKKEKKDDAADERENREKPLTLRRVEVSKRTLYFLFLTFCLQIKAFLPR